MQLGKAFGALESSPEGLSDLEAAQWLRTHNPTRIDRGPRWSWLKVLLRQLADPLVYVLLAAALTATLKGKVTDGLVVLDVVNLNTLIGFVQEMHAGKAIDALSRVVP